MIGKFLFLETTIGVVEPVAELLDAIDDAVELSGLAVFFLCLAFLLGLVRFLYYVYSRCDVLVCWSCLPHELFLVRLDSFLTGLRETQHVSKSMILCHPSALAGCWWGTIYIIVSLVPRTTRGGLQAHSVIVGCESNRFSLLPPDVARHFHKSRSSRRVAPGQGFSCATRSRSGSTVDTCSCVCSRSRLAEYHTFST